MKTFFAVLVFCFAVIAAAHTLNAACPKTAEHRACPVSTVMAAGHPDVIAGLVTVSVEATVPPDASDWQDRVETALVEVTDTRDELIADWKALLAVALSARYVWMWAFLGLALLVRW
jgi:pimeloyl-ACP methyl ester carboxylesterase